MSKSSIVWRLLRRNISPGQIAGYALANLVGLAIVLTALQFYRDFSGTDSDGDDAFALKDYIVISKPVSILNTLGAGSATFSPEEIAKLQAQPWVKRTGSFTSADFNVYASLNMGGRGMSTYLFFESVPDDFFDVKPKEWTFNPENPEITIVISKDYLALYNFGFAATRGMPQLSEDLIKKVPLKIRLSGNGRMGEYEAKIVGFSSRLNTIAVPEDFLEWANAEYSGNMPHDPSRLIVEVTNPGAPEVNDYIRSHGYEVAGDKEQSGKSSYFLSVATAVVVGVGVMISLLAFFILLLSIYLLLQKSREKLRDLMLLGYTPGGVSVYYCRLVAGVNVAVLIAAIVVMLISSGWWNSRLGTLGMSQSSVWPTIGIGAAIMGVITVANILIIRSRIRRMFV